MRTLFVFILLTAHGYAAYEHIQKAYKEFYNNELVQFARCGENTQYFIDYLNTNDIPYKKIIVVKIEEPFAYLNHFNSRWGRKEIYPQNNSIYYRSNWYYHYFAIIDGYVVDLSSRAHHISDLMEYLYDSYIPRYQTKSILLQGKLGPNNIFSKLENIKLKLFTPIFTLGKNQKAYYEGSFIELFNNDASFL